MFRARHLLCSNQDISCVPIKTFHRSHERHVLVLKEHMWWLPQRTCGSSQGRHVLVLKEHMWWFPRKTCGASQEDLCWRTVRDVMGWNFGRTDLRISASTAKFDARADGHVRLAVRSPKPRKICKTKFSDPKISRKKVFRRRKIKFRESSETRFGKFSRRSEPSLRHKRPLAEKNA